MLVLEKKKLEYIISIDIKIYIFIQLYSKPPILVHTYFFKYVICLYFPIVFSDKKYVLIYSHITSHIFSAIFTVGRTIITNGT